MAAAAETDTAVRLPPLEALPENDLENLRSAATVVVETSGALARRDTNVVGVLLPETGAFHVRRHYPPGDVRDPAAGTQYYYHAHRPGEHGHFHSFFRRTALAGVEPITAVGGDSGGGAALSHLVAIGMDAHGVPIRLFTVNRWVVHDTVYPAAALIDRLPAFRIAQDAGGHPVTNRWITAMVALFRPQIEQLLLARDRRLAEALGDTVFEDRTLEVLSSCPVSVVDQLDWLGMLA